jgi:pyruvate dehydrogenase E2 component (dihydrolipoamide acetyltransferase)
MPTDVLMPQMGESIAEGTVVRWIKSVGDTVDPDEPLFEISTDKVDAEIPSPVGGVLLQIRTEVGETVAVNTVVALIGAEGETAIPVESPYPAAAPSPAASSVGAVSSPSSSAAGGTIGRRLSPVVRRLAAEHGVDLSAVQGTGDGGRVTKTDVLAHVAAAGSPAGTAEAEPGTRIEPMTVMRRRIAEHMTASRHTAAHVHTLFEVDFSALAHRRSSAPEPRAGYLAHIARAVAQTLVEMPVLNASVDGDSVVYHDRVNLGVAVALDWGLIVPVVKDADQLGVRELDQAIADLAARARAKQLSPVDVADGTFTITNPGVFGSIAGLPIINHPESAILCVGAIEQRPAVVDGVVVARLRAYLTLGFDHRLIDGAVADRFLGSVKQKLELASE